MGQGQTFNIYEIYGFDVYSFDENSTENGDAKPPCRPVIPPMTHSHTPACQSVMHPLPGSQAPHDSQAELNNVFEQLLKNSLKNNNSPLTPQRGREGRDGKFEIQKPQNQKHDTEAKGKSLKTDSNALPLHGAILAAFSEILPELPGAEKLTASRIKTLNSRIGEDPARKETDWWRKYFERVRLFPWLMGRNPNNWKATFDWLIGEGGMQKVIEGGFIKAPHPEHSCEELRELQRKYTDERGIVDAKALLRDWRAGTLGTSGMV
jgi:hypothetical protein